MVPAAPPAYALGPHQIPESTSAQGSDYAYVFVCQQGDLSGMALLLAASLRRFLRGNYELIAAIPQPEATWGRPDDAVLAALEAMDVRTVPVQNPIDRQLKGNPLTNKIYALQVPTDCDKLVFLDSDLLCLRPFDPASQGIGPNFSGPFSAAPTFLATGRNWEQIYAAVGQPVPSQRIKTLFSEDRQPPYFNSGFIAMDAALAPKLTATWLDCFDKINQTGAMVDNLYFREQVCLAVAVMTLGLEYQLLDWRYNYWVKYQPLDPQNLPYFLHHTWPHPPMYHQPWLRDLVQSLVAEHPAIGPYVARCRWKYYLRSPALVAVNRAAHQHRRRLKRLGGKSLTQFMIHGHG